LFGVIQGVEITLRNAVNTELQQKFGENWFDALFEKWLLLQQSQIQTAKKQVLRGKESEVKASDIIAELNFGFWVALFAGRYDVPLWHTSLHKVFCKTVKRKAVYQKLARLRILRNRIAHHEPILDHNLQSDYQDIMELLTAISPDVAKWVRYHNRFDDVWNNKPTG